MNDRILGLMAVQGILLALLGLISASRIRGAAARHCVLLGTLIGILGFPLVMGVTCMSGLKWQLPPTVVSWVVIPDSSRESAGGPVDETYRLSTGLQQSDSADDMPSDRQPRGVDDRRRSLGSSVVQKAISRVELFGWPVWESAVSARNDTAQDNFDRPSRSDGPFVSETGSGLRADREDADSAAENWIRVGGWPLWSLLKAVWAAGAVWFLAGLCRAESKVLGILRSARTVSEMPQPESARLAEVIAIAAKRLKTRLPLHVAVTGKVPGPLVAGCFPPRILIPARYLEILSRDELLQVLVHEGAHALRRDPLIAGLQRIVAALNWWNPLLREVNRRLVQAREEICDNSVLADVEPVFYGATLLKLATLAPSGPNLALAVGMLSRPSQLEERIRGLLDEDRLLQTRVRGRTKLAVGVLLVGISVGLAAAQGAPESPSLPPIATALASSGAGDTAAADHVEENRSQGTDDTTSGAGIDAAANSSAGVGPSQVPEVGQPAASQDPLLLNSQQFRLVLTYHGSADKPHYAVTLSVPPVAHQTSPFQLLESISEDDARRVIAHLQNSGFFRFATRPETQNDPTEGPQYLLRVSDGQDFFEESLGWDLGTFLRLTDLQRVLSGPARAALERVIVRLSGHRQIWESGEPRNGLRAQMTGVGFTTPLEPGKPVPIRLELINTATESRDYERHDFLQAGSEITVWDGHGRRVPYRGFGVGQIEQTAAIEPGETVLLQDLDLSNGFYLRRAGEYVVTFKARGLPASNAVRFRIAAKAVRSEDGPATAGVDGGDDGDPMERLLRLESPQWRLQGSANASARIRPGLNHTATRGWQFAFVDAERGVKGSRSIVWVWLTESPAAKSDSGQTDDAIPMMSETLGQIRRWHVYFAASPEAQAAWPTFPQDLRDALEEKPLRQPPVSREQGFQMLHDQFHRMIVTAALRGDSDELTRLTRFFNESAEGAVQSVQIVRRTGPVEEHRTVLNWWRDSTPPQLAKIHFAAGNRPHVVEDKSAGIVVVATPMMPDRHWPRDVQVTLAFDHAWSPPTEIEAVRRLFPLVRDGWWLGTSVAAHATIKPGRNWETTTGQIVRLVIDPPVSRGSGLIQLWLADQHAAATVDRLSSLPESESLGLIGRWHVYLLMSESANMAWPTARKDIRTALGKD